MSVSTIILFFVILLVLVIVHEFGHFIVAKWVGMRVDEFAFGFPPRIFAKKYGETTYAINALPLGGYVAIWGENGEPDDEAKSHPRAFGNRPWWAQLLVLVAGVTMNMLLAFVILISISYGDIRVSSTDPVYGSRVNNVELVVLDTAPNSPALNAGIIAGSVITKVTSAGATATLTDANAFISFVGVHANSPFVITFKKPTGEIVTTTIASVYGIIPDKKALGISVDTLGTVRTTVKEAIIIGSERTYEITKQTFDGLKIVFSSLTTGNGEVLQQLSGPIGIAKIVGTTSEYGVAAVLLLVATLSINLAIFNILPLPALDGGRMIVVAIEAIGRRKIPFKYYSWINMLGFMALILLLVVVTIHDINR